MVIFLSYVNLPEGSIPKNHGWLLYPQGDRVLDLMLKLAAETWRKIRGGLSHDVRKPLWSFLDDFQVPCLITEKSP